MKSVLVVFWVAISLALVQPCFARVNLCRLASEVVDKTPEEIEAFYNQKVYRRIVNGSGQVHSIKQPAKGTRGSYQVEILCSPKVMVRLQVGELWIKRNKATKGAMVTFKGDCTRMHKSMNYLYCIVREVTR